jgi:hypothetical protein
MVAHSTKTLTGPCPRGFKLLKIFGLALAFILASELATVAGVKAEVFNFNNVDSYYISLASDAYQGALNIYTVSPTQTGRVAVIDNKLQISTNDPGGYHLLISTTNGYNELVQPGNPTKVLPVSGTVTDPKPLDSNTWGFAVDHDKGVEGNGFDDSYSTTPSDTAEYAAVPRKSDNAVLVRRTFEQNANDVYDNVTFHYGVKVNMDLPAGLYHNEIVYTAMTETTATMGDYTGYSEPKSIQIDENMIPVKYVDNAGTPQWQKADIANDDNDWFSYSDKKWANAVTVRPEALEDLKQAPVDQIIEESEILGYWVYIPRYRYKVQGAMTQDNASQLGELTYAKRQQTPRDFEIEFQNYDDPKFVNTKIATWITHPAFSFGSCTADQTHCIGETIELDGIWIGKFETSKSTNTATTTSTTDAFDADPVIKPSIQSRRSQSATNQFTTAQYVRSYHNLTPAIDTRMSKNSDWGAAAYLATSKYGKGAGTNQEVWINPSSSYITGCAGTGPSASSSSGCSYNYYTTNGNQASTTGNVYGIYDMSGGAFDRVATKFNSSTLDKYYDNFTVTSNNNCIPTQCLGQALYETASWNGDYADFVSSGIPWFVRGGDCNDATTAGLFASYGNGGSANANYGFRVSLSVF